jgi:transcriptional regulator with PAS, ATPase and Fis domain
MAIVVRDASTSDFSRAQQSAETRARDGPTSGDGLIAASRELITLGDRSSILESIPRIAMGISPARSAQLLEIKSAGTGVIVATHGLPLQMGTQEIIGRVRSMVDADPTEPLLGVSISDADTARFLLVLEREPGGTFSPEEIRHLEMFALVCSTVLARAQSDAALQAARAIESAIVEAVHDAVIAFDGKGVVRALSVSAASLIGRRRHEIVGQHLRDVPGMGPLALSLQGEHCPDTLKLSLAAATVRLLRYAGGLAVAVLAPGGAMPRIDAAHFHIDDLLGESPPIVRARETARRVADSHLPVVLTGETGTGKEILAQGIHNVSARAHEPFVAVNVSAIPRELLESELFGYEAGAFTGASTHGHPGKFELARNGTLLLDEVSDMPLEMQAKLLRILQERVVTRLGASRAYPFMARVIASTNRDLEHEVSEGRFRIDLLHRLRGVHIELPPLRERGDDVRLLVAHQLRVLAQRTGRATIHIAPTVMAAMETYRWPGNARELVTMLECEVSLLPPGKDVIDVVPRAIERSIRFVGTATGADESMTLDAAQREACLRALEKTGGNVERAARVLRVAKATLYSKMRRYGIAHPHARPRHRGPADG